MAYNRTEQEQTTIPAPGPRKADPTPIRRPTRRTPDRASDRADDATRTDGHPEGSEAQALERAAPGASVQGIKTWN